MSRPEEDPRIRPEANPSPIQYIGSADFSRFTDRVDDVFKEDGIISSLIYTRTYRIPGYNLVTETLQAATIEDGEAQGFDEDDERAVYRFGVTIYDTSGNCADITLDSAGYSVARLGKYNQITSSHNYGDMLLMPPDDVKLLAKIMGIINSPKDASISYDYCQELIENITNGEDYEDASGLVLEDISDEAREVAKNAAIACFMCVQQDTDGRLSSRYFYEDGHHQWVGIERLYDIVPDFGRMALTLGAVTHEFEHVSMRYKEEGSIEVDCTKLTSTNGGRSFDFTRSVGSNTTHLAMLAKFVEIEIQQKLDEEDNPNRLDRLIYLHKIMDKINILKLVLRESSQNTQEAKGVNIPRIQFDRVLRLMPADD